MSRFESTIVVDVPVRVAYDQWTRFESFPRFMDGVQSVEQLDGRSLAWVAIVSGRREAWTMEIVDQTPDRRIAWRSTEGTAKAGAVRFVPIGDDRVRVTLRLDADPDGPSETVGDGLGSLQRQVTGDLGRFKRFVEGESPPSAGRHREIDDPSATKPPGPGRPPSDG
jgi:uncharacterized membrane protein